MPLDTFTYYLLKVGFIPPLRAHLVSLKTMLLCLKMVKNIFEENLDDNLLISLKGDSDHLEKHNLETSGRYLRQQEQIKILTGKQFVNINCGVCNDCNGK